MKPLRITTRAHDKAVAALATHETGKRFLPESGPRVVSWNERREILRQDMLDARPDPDAIVRALAAVNGRASAHAITQAYEVAGVAERAEQLLHDRGVTLGNRVGTFCIFHPSGPGKAYSRKARSVVTTHIILKRVADGWRLVGVEKMDQWADGKELFLVDISEAAAENIRTAAFVSVVVRPAEQAAA